MDAESAFQPSPSSQGAPFRARRTKAGTNKDIKNRRGDVSEASLSVLLDEAETLALLSSHDEGNRVGGVGGVRVSGLGVEHLLGCRSDQASLGVSFPTRR
jgi:hypothetical protein